MEDDGRLLPSEGARPRPESGGPPRRVVAARVPHSQERPAAEGHGLEARGEAAAATSEGSQLSREASLSAGGGDGSEALLLRSPDSSGGTRAGSRPGSEAQPPAGLEVAERLQWTPSLHEQFVAAVDACGGPMQAKVRAPEVEERSWLSRGA